MSSETTESLSGIDPTTDFDKTPFVGAVVTGPEFYKIYTVSVKLASMSACVCGTRISTAFHNTCTTTELNTL